MTLVLKAKKQRVYKPKLKVAYTPLKTWDIMQKNLNFCNRQHGMLILFLYCAIKIPLLPI
jgi:hypothetical protein